MKPWHVGSLDADRSGGRSVSAESWMNIGSHIMPMFVQPPTSPGVIISVSYRIVALMPRAHGTHHHHHIFVYLKVDKRNSYKLYKYTNKGNRKMVND